MSTEFDKKVETAKMQKAEAARFGKEYNLEIVPKASDIMGGQQIYKTSDKLILLYKGEEDKAIAEKLAIPEPKHVKLKIEKNRRGGGEGKIFDFCFDGDKQIFKSISLKKTSDS